jgi:hypothetical protein
MKRQYSSVISLTKNARGVYSLDPSIGCGSGLLNNKLGCYNDCYAAKSAKLYGYDFSNTVFRDFKNDRHRRKILKQISKIKLGFVRMGTSGDPSENWEHTLSIIEKIKTCNKEVVIITKHWTNLTENQLERLRKYNVCINTSVSALDDKHLLENSLFQYHVLKSFCKSVLRIISCDFNLQNKVGLDLSKIQSLLFENVNTIDTILRVNKNNPLVKDGVIKAQESVFLGKKCLVSRYQKKTYFGKCSTCKEMCGIKVINDFDTTSKEVKIANQLSLL